MLCVSCIIIFLSQRDTMRVFTKVNGNLLCWDVDTTDPELAIKTVRDEVGLKHRGTILALVKY